MKLKKNKHSGGQGGQGICEQRREYFVKIQKKIGGSGWEVWVDVNGEVKFLWKFKKMGGGGGSWGSDLGSGLGMI